MTVVEENSPTPKTYLMQHHFRKRKLIITKVEEHFEYSYYTSLKNHFENINEALKYKTFYGTMFFEQDGYELIEEINEELNEELAKQLFPEEFLWMN